MHQFNLIKKKTPLQHLEIFKIWKELLIRTTWEASLILSRHQNMFKSRNLFLKVFVLLGNSQLSFPLKRMQTAALGVKSEALERFFSLNRVCRISTHLIYRELCLAFANLPPSTDKKRVFSISRSVRPTQQE